MTNQQDYFYDEYVRLGHALAAIGELQEQNCRGEVAGPAEFSEAIQKVWDFIRAERVKLQAAFPPLEFPNIPTPAETLVDPKYRPALQAAYDLGILTPTPSEAALLGLEFPLVESPSFAEKAEKDARFQAGVRAAIKRNLEECQSKVVGSDDIEAVGRSFAEKAKDLDL